MMDSSKPDNDGYTADEEPISNGETALPTLLPVKQICKALQHEGFDAKVSNSAGLFVCNRVYTQHLRYVKKIWLEALFVHLPLYDGQLSAINDAKSVPLESMAATVRNVNKNN